MVTVAVNGHPVAAVTVRRGGRVLLPLRATFSALGATVRYEPRGRIIVAHDGDRTIRLRVGSTAAFVNEKRLLLDVPPQIVASSAFVPVRFVAQAFGARVTYDPRDALVSITTAAPPPVARITVTAQVPAPGSQVPTAYPNVTATVTGAGAARGNISLSIDGQDVTALASFDGRTITFLPRTAMTPGAHTVAFSGRTLDGGTFASRWSFTTVGTPPSDQSSVPTNYAYQFFVNGPSQFRYGDWMRFTLLAPPGGSAYLQLCNLGYQYALSNGGSTNAYVADIPAPYGYWVSSCPVQAVYTSWTGQQYIVPVPVYVSLFTVPQPYPFVAGTPTPAPATTGRMAPLPPDRRAVEPKATPVPISVPVPKVHPPAHVPKAHDPALPRKAPELPAPKPVKPSPRAT